MREQQSGAATRGEGAVAREAYRSFLFRRLDLAPLLDRLSQVDAVHGDLDLSNLVMFGEAIEVVDREDEGLRDDLVVGDFEVEGFIEDGIQGLSVDLRLELLLLVRKEVDFAVGITGATGVAGRQLFCLKHRHS